MSFHLREDCKKYFSKIKSSTGPIKTDWDIYYFCLVLGLITKKSIDMTRVPHNEFNRNFTPEYKGQQFKLIGMLVVVRAKAESIEMDEKESITRLFNRITEPGTSTRLSSQGFTYLNDYCSGGFEYFRDNSPKAPDNHFQFLRLYRTILDKANQADGNNNKGFTNRAKLTTRIEGI